MRFITFRASSAHTRQYSQLNFASIHLARHVVAGEFPEGPNAGPVELPPAEMGNLPDLAKVRGLHDVLLCVSSERGILFLLVRQTSAKILEGWEVDPGDPNVLLTAFKSAYTWKPELSALICHCADLEMSSCGADLGRAFALPARTGIAAGVTTRVHTEVAGHLQGASLGIIVYKLG